MSSKAYLGETRPYAAAIQRLRGAGLRPTQQRVALARLIFGAGDRHLTAEQLHTEALAARVRVSLATVYNSLHQFVAAGLLREVVVEAGRCYFDTNVAAHHHFYCLDSGRLQDIPVDGIRLANLPVPPADSRIEQVDVVVRVRRI
ncbi:MAG: transcriptional repressor [Alphaproteobacteria bacterium]|nr:transcriptional repressor [Alphaproteobacteria bacterium]